MNSFIDHLKDIKDNPENKSKIHKELIQGIGRLLTEGVKVKVKNSDFTSRAFSVAGEFPSLDFTGHYFNHIKFKDFTHLVISEEQCQWVIQLTESEFVILPK